MANILQQLTSIGSIPIAPETLRMYLRAQPVYNDNRERAAVVLGQGFDAYDTYVAWKTPIFILALANAAFSGWMLWKRKAHGSEAVALWSANFVASAGVAYVTRPATIAKPPAGLTSQETSDFNVVATIDAKRAKMRSDDPGFADKVFSRLAAMPGIREPLAANPLVRAAIV